MNEHNSWEMVEMARIYREERLREAAQYRLATAAAAEQQPRTAEWVEHLLYNVGMKLAVWGVSLKERYRCAGELNVSPAGDC